MRTNNTYCNPFSPEMPPMAVTLTTTPAKHTGDPRPPAEVGCSSNALARQRRTTAAAAAAERKGSFRRQNEQNRQCTATLLPSLTVCDLQQGLGNYAAGNVESLAAVQAAVRVLNVGNGQTARLGHGETAGRLWRLVREEETLEEERGRIAHFNNVCPV